MFGGGSAPVQATQPPAAGMRVQTSIYGNPIPIVWGTNRLAGNLIWYGDFRAETVAGPSGGGKGGGSGGKGGGGGGSSYVYSASWAMAICEGPIQDYGTCWRNKEVLSTGPGAINDAMSLFYGSYPQTAWTHLTTNHPTEAIPYEGTAYVASVGARLSDSADMDQMSFEIYGRNIYNYAGAIYDANPKDVVNDFLTNTNYGPQGLSTMLGSLTQYSNYCLANNLLLSPMLDGSISSRQFLTDLMQITNSGIYWSEGQIKVVPFGDETVVGSLATFTPNLTPAYDLDDDSFCPSTGEDPVVPLRRDPSDCYNQVTIEFVNRSNQYAPETVDAKDQASIDQYGVRQMPTIKTNAITSTAVARFVAQLILNRQQYVGRNTYQFKLHPQYARLEPTDLVTITDAKLGLSRQLVRITEVDEDENDVLTITAEELPIGVAATAAYTSQAGAGYAANYNVAPGNINTPIMFVAPYQLSQGFLEVWMGLSGGTNFGGCEIWVSTDNASYEWLDTFYGKSRQGVTTSLLNNVADPDTTSTLGVNLSMSGGQLLSGTAANADAFDTLCYVGGELISYQTATLTAANQYNLTTRLRRGAYGSTIGSHASGQDFLRLDDALYRRQFPQEWNGRTIYLKFLSFNPYGAAKQKLSDVSAYTITLSQSWSGLPGLQNIAGLQLFGSGGTSWTGRDAKFTWTKYALGNLIEPYLKDYKIEIWSDTGGGLTLRRTEFANDNFYIYSYEKNFEDHSGTPNRGFTIKVWRRGEYGNLSPVATTLAVTNPAPALPSSVSLTAAFKNVFLRYTPPNETDWAGVQIWASTSTGFTPGAGNLVYDGSDSLAVIPEASNTTYYVRYAAYDTFGKTGLTVSGEISILTQQIITTELVDNVINAAKLADLSVDGAAIQPNVILGSHMVNSTITRTQILDGEIITPKLAANSVTVSKLLVASSPSACLNADPDCKDTSAWTAYYANLPTFSTTTTGSVGDYVIRSSAGLRLGMVTGPIAIDSTKKYRVRAVVRSDLAIGSGLYVGALEYVHEGDVITSYNAANYAAASNLATTTSWQTFKGTLATFNATSRYIRGFFILNYNEVASRFSEIQDFRVEEIIPGDLIVDGAITAVKIAANTITGDRIAANTITVTNLLVANIGAALNADPDCKDITAWETYDNAAYLLTGFATGTNPIVGSQVMYNTGLSSSGYCVAYQKPKSPYDPLKSYRIRMRARGYNSSAAFYLLCYLFANENDVPSSYMAYTGYAGATLTTIGISGSYSPYAWKFKDSDFTTTVGGIRRYMALSIWLFGNIEVQDARLEEAVPASLIVDGTITALQIAANTITAGQIAAATITASELAADSVTSAKILAGTIQASDIAASTITGSNIAGATITGTNIAGSTITASNMVTGTITAASGILANAVITNAKIGDLEVDTIKITNGAISSTDVAAATTSGTLSGTTNLGVDITHTVYGTASVLLLIGIASWKVIGTATGPVEIKLELYNVTTSAVVQSNSWFGTQINIGGSENPTQSSSGGVLTVAYKITGLAAGSYTFRLRMAQVTGTGTGTYYNRTLILTELMK